MPGLYREIRTSYQKGELKRARDLQLRGNQVTRTLISFGFPGALREAMRVLGFECGDPRLPFPPLPAEKRQALREQLQASGVGSEVYYPHPLHLQECFAECGFPRCSLPETERAADEVLSLPIFPGLTVDEQQVVVARIKDFFAMRQASAA